MTLQKKESPPTPAAEREPMSLEKMEERLAQMEASLNAKAAQLDAREADLEAELEDKRNTLLEGPAAPAGDDRVRRDVTVSLLERHFVWLEKDAQFERFRRRTDDWDLAKSLEKILRMQVSIDPYCHGMLNPGQSATGKAGEFNPVAGRWGG